MSIGLLSFPRSLWRLYVDYLWNYDAASWVASTAYTFRVLAFLTLLPFLILTALDIASYVIARTLGVIDDTKAATSERAALPTGRDTPAIVVRDASGTPADTPATAPPPSYFRNTAEEGNLQLAGVDLISPAPSQPPSPKLRRSELGVHELRRGEAGAGAGGAQESPESSSSESSYAMLERERDSGTEASGLVLRKRVRPVGDTHVDA